MKGCREMLLKEEEEKDQILFLMVFICQRTPELGGFCQAGSSEPKEEIRERIRVLLWRWSSCVLYY